MSSEGASPLGSRATSPRRTAGAGLLRDRLRERGSRPAAARPHIPTVPRDGAPPLSFAQRRLWLMDRLRPGGTDYLVPVVLRLRGDVSALDIQAGLTALVGRHEILRTRYGTDEDGGPVQLVDPPGEVPLARDDLRGRPQDAVDALLTAETTRPFDLATGPVLRARLVRLADTEHLLVIVLHHIAVDGWSCALLVDELAALCAGKTLPPPSLQYADFAAWQRGHFTGERLEHGLTHWRERLRDLPVLRLPLDRARPAVWAAEARTVPFDIPAPTAARLAALAREQRATPFMVLLAGFCALLGRYTGQDDFAVGTPIAGRTHPQTHSLLGALINLLALRVDLSGDPTFTELLDRVRDTALDAFDHQDVPFDAVVDALAPGRDTSIHPLVNVNFVVQNNDPARFRAGEITGEPVPVLSDRAKFDLSWTLEERQDGSIGGEATVATALFDPGTAERMACHYVRLLKAVAADPATRVSRLPLLGDAERALLTGGPARTVAHGPCLHERFAEQAARHPHATALTFGDEHLSYAELDARANRLAHRLRGLGAGRDRLVAIRMPRGIEMIVAVLGVLKAGAAYLPLDPDQPAERIAYILQDAGATVLLTLTGQADDGTDTGAGIVEEVLLLDDPEEAARLTRLPAHAPAVAADPDDLAYVIYTSGSTGRPKGVQIHHAHVVRLLNSAQGDYLFGPDDVWPLFHSYGFDVSVWEIWGAFCHGGRLVVVPYDVTRSPWDLMDLLAAEGVTVLNQTPSAFRSLVELAERGEGPLDRLRLRWVVLAGEALDIEMLRPWWDRFGDEAPRIVNMYGITETTVHASLCPLSRADLGGDRSPIGRPLCDLRLYVLDDRMRPVPVGVVGEIHVGGPGVARGYLGRPRLTAGRFVPDPFGAPGARLYRSGDLARVLPDGELAFVGRRDDQVKIRGFRIELGEVEACLAAHPRLDSVVAVAHGPDGGERELVCYAVPKEGAEVTPSDIRAHAAQALPGYMVPSLVMVLPRLPLTPNGKVDRRALPAPDRGRQVRAAGPVAPRTPTEQAVARVWQRVLGLDQVGVYDGFFALGGDSIRAVRLVGMLRAQGFECSVQDVFRHQTVAELVGSAAGGSGPDGAERAGTRPFELIGAEDRAKLPDGLVDAYPMSRVQSGMLHEMFADPEHRPYHNVTSYLIRDDGPFDALALRAAVRDVVAGHEVLRTSFDPAGYREPLQLVHAEAEPEVGCHDLRALPDVQRQALLGRFRDGERERVFDLGTAPRIRFHAHRRTDDEWYLSLTECHTILDGWSHNSLVTELLDRYRAHRAGERPPQRRSTEVRYADFIAQEQRSLADGEDRAFWAGRLAGAHRVALPGAWADPDGPATYSVVVPFRDLEPGLRALADRAGASLKSVLLSAHLAVWRTVAGEEPYYMGLVCNGRTEVAGGDRVAGMFLNPLPFVAPTQAATWRELVRGVFEEELALWPHRRYPLPELQREFGGGRRLLEVDFNYLDFHVLDRTRVDTDGSTDISPNEFPLEVATRSDGLLLAGQSRRIGRRYTELLARMYRTAMERMAADADGDARVPLLSERELTELLPEGRPAPARHAGERPRENPAAAPAAPADAPDGAVERAIAEVWAEALGVDRVGPDDDFFTLGGHSLLTVRIIVRLRHGHGIDLSFRDFQRHRTVRSLAAAVSANRPARPERTLQWFGRGGDLPPLFCVHPSGGSAHWYRELADHYAGRRPLAALEWPGLHGGPTPEPTVRGVATAYLGRLRAARPDGPYHILGYSGSSGIAWEMARTLAAAGEDVRLLLLDPVCDDKGADQGPLRDAVARLRRAEDLFRALRERPYAPGAGQRRAELVDLVRSVVDDGDTWSEQDTEGGIGDAWAQRLRSWRVLLEMQLDHVFPAWPGRLDLLLSDDLASGRAHPGGGTDPYLNRWRELAVGGLHVRRVPGGHESCLRAPHVAVLAAELSGLLDSGGADRGSGPAAAGTRGERD
ncbi:non-ribosomal peptide synthetase [Streptomyces sp. AK010]|uniref:non-ribosomal peptide synthetase n=1 Tax=Streptomyces sp. AK010 TaxID=2723074 RepID=UPI00160CCEB6|nr:non-ribosomal peptide synthetase [Streptomyces sp. AK010]MBB6421374.1 amino acid adenylation domain-containing protein [Streptomyces sp. AK010]